TADGTPVTLSIEREGGGGTALASSTSGSLNYTATQDGVYHVRAEALWNYRGPRAQYQLNLTVTDGVPPPVLATTLPAQAGTTTAVVDRFSLPFSEAMAPAPINNLASYELLAAGPDDTFGTPDDVRYALAAPGYTAGTTVQYRITDGPLQPGR